ncbi:MAG TPA: glucose-6-phosphate dehydrogenase [Candidatus Dormibacteraeota bacterium]|jgi:glucose-6-phosphate 1-dehydrogenase|nr:glucose-6-phosphate dehydrogenase [Candidatus Dormibacteraeota bacterium]
MTLRQPAEQDVVVFGASGDLAARKLLPALYNLAAEDLLPEQGDVVGAAPVDWSDEDFRKHAHDAIKTYSRSGLDEAAWQRFAPRLRFVPIREGGGIKALKGALKRPRRLVYLAVPSSAFEELVHDIGEGGLADGTSLIIEKPFGHDLDSAHSLNNALHAVLPEERIYRIDHYLGKETVQNLLVFRFGNALFERVWNRDCIERIEISVAESIGVDGRGRFYEETGALRDIVQNHLFQVMSIVAMEAPVSFDAEALRNEKVKVLRAVQPLHPHEVVRGQYTAGSIDGKPVEGYRGEPGVAPDSTTETFAAMRVSIDTWRWSGVPFLLRTGKRLRRRDTRIVVVFRDVPLHFFAGLNVGHMDSNILVVRIQPDEGISLDFVAKQPGPEITTQTVRMDFSYGTSFKTSPPEAYERLLHDALLGDHTLFIREDEVERGWQIIDPILRAEPPVLPYEAGTWGPERADEIAGHWHSLEDHG